AAVHDHHGELGPAALDPVDVGELGPDEVAEDGVHPGEGGLGVLEGLPVGPVVVAGAVEDVDRNVLITAALVDVVGRRAPGEVVDIAGDPADALAAGGRVAGEEAEGLGGADV